MTQIITRTQEEKLDHVRSLMKKYADHLETVSKLVESGIQFMEEPEMAVFLQVCYQQVKNNSQGHNSISLSYNPKHTYIGDNPFESSKWHS